MAASKKFSHPKETCILFLEHVPHFSMWTSIFRYEGENMFEISDRLGHVILRATEDSNCCSRQCCERLRPFEMIIKDRQSNIAIKMIRPRACDNCICCPCWNQVLFLSSAKRICSGTFDSFGLSFQTLHVECPPGNYVGFVEQNVNIYKPTFDIFAADGETKKYIIGKIVNKATWLFVYFFVYILQRDRPRVSLRWEVFATRNAASVWGKDAFVVVKISFSTFLTWTGKKWAICKNFGQVRWKNREVTFSWHPFPRCFVASPVDFLKSSLRHLLLESGAVFIIAPCCTIPKYYNSSPNMMLKPVLQNRKLVHFRFDTHTSGFCRFGQVRQVWTWFSGRRRAGYQSGTCGKLLFDWLPLFRRRWRRRLI